MFRNQAEGIRLRQWSGWKLYLSVFIHRECPNGVASEQDDL